MSPTTRKSSAAAKPAARGTSAAVLTINRAPVFTLWAAVVAERLGFDRDEAVTLGKVVAGLNAQSKARHLGIARPGDKKDFERRRAAEKAAAADEVLLCGRAVPVTATRAGLRAMSGGKPVDPAAVHRYLESKFGDGLTPARAAMTALAAAHSPQELAARAFDLYAAFRPAIPAGKRGWGAKGVLDLALVRGMAKKGVR